MKKVGLTSEFPFGIYWWTLKNPKKQNFQKKWKKFAGDKCVHVDIIAGHVYQKPRSYEVQFLRYEVTQKFLSFWTLFCPFNTPYLLTTRKKNFFEKLNKASGQIWNGTDNFFVIWGHFLLFYPTIDPKNCKNHLEVLSFYTCLPLWFKVPEI